MDAMPLSDLLLACSFWLQLQIEAIIPLVNQKIAGLYEFEVPAAALFNTAVTMGELTNTAVPVFCVWASQGSQPIQNDIHDITPEQTIGLTYIIRIVLPKAGGDNTTSDFELSKQIAVGALMALLDNTAVTMQPVVATKADPDVTVKAQPPCRRGPWRTAMFRTLADHTTSARMVETSFNFWFQTSGGLVLSTP